MNDTNGAHAAAKEIDAVTASGLSLEASHVQKTYGGRRVVDDVSRVG